jgi:hypothetical protein
MSYLTKLDEGLFINNETNELFTLKDGNFVPLENSGAAQQSAEDDDEFGFDFMSDRLAEADAKIESGEIVCNLDNPDDCEACGS